MASINFEEDPIPVVSLLSSNTPPGIYVLEPSSPGFQPCLVLVPEDRKIDSAFTIDNAQFRVGTTWAKNSTHTVRSFFGNIKVSTK